MTNGGTACAVAVGIEAAKAKHRPTGTALEAIDLLLTGKKIVKEIGARAARLARRSGVSGVSVRAIRRRTRSTAEWYVRIVVIPNPFG
jgi:hypothetical protein